MAEVRQFNLTNKFLGYFTKADKTKIGPAYLVDGSRNVLTTENQTVTSRQGYTLDGQANSNLAPIISSFDWNTSTGVERNLRGYSDELEYRYVASDGTITWRQLKDSFSEEVINFATYWDTDEIEDILLFVDTTSNIFAWSGGITTIDSVTASTITKEGTETWAETRFISDGTNYDKKIIINGTEYTYTGGEGTTTLTGVTPNPVGNVSNGDIAHQSVTTITNSAITGLPNAFKNTIIEVLDNQVWVGSNDRRDVYVSKINDLTDFSFTSPRLIGEGALLTLDGVPNGFVIQEQFMYISVKKSGWFQSDLTISSDNVREILTVVKLKTGPQQSAQAQSAIGKAKNSVIFISNEPTLDSLSRVQNIITPQTKPISDPIKPDFDNATFTTKADVKYFKNDIYVLFPSDSELRKYNIEEGYWDPPWDLPAGRLAIIGDELYLHSNSVPETYKLFDGFNDNENPINAIAKFGYITSAITNNGLGELRANQKFFTEWFTEGYIAANTTLNIKLLYDFNGFTTIANNEIVGATDKKYVFVSESGGNLGKQNLGKQKLGGISSGNDLNKFRKIHELNPNNYYELQPIYFSDDVDFRWEILSFGGDIKPAKDDNAFIKHD